MPQTKDKADCRCTQEARLTAIETKLATKKEHLHEVDEDYYHLRDKLESININVAELTTLLRENKAQEEKNDKKIDELTKEMSNLKTDILNVDKKVDNTNSSLDTMKWLIPLVCSILMFIINYLT